MKRIILIPITVLCLAKGQMAVADSFKVINSTGQISEQREDILIGREVHENGFYKLLYYTIDGDGVVGSNGTSFSDQYGYRLETHKLSSEERAKLVEKWKRSGRSAQITHTGVSDDLSNVHLTSSAPEGYAYYRPPVGNVPYVERNTLQVRVAGTVRHISLSDVTRLSKTENDMSLKLKDGRSIVGEFIWPTYEDRRYGLKFMGVRYQSDGTISQFSVPFEQISDLQFNN